MSIQKELLSAKETAIYLGVTEGTLAVWRSNKTYPINYIKVGGKIMYRKSEIDTWLDEQTITIPKAV